VGAAAGEIIGGFTGMFRKKKKPREPDPADIAVTVFRVTTEVTDWDDGDIPESRFEVPSGWNQL
jgi:hypothetical protein